MRNVAVVSSLFAVTLLHCGCSVWTVRMAPVDPPWQDDSSVAATLTPGKVHSVMIVPPSGTARSEFEANLAAAERALLRRGLRVISPAVTARVVLQGQERKDETAGSLSDVERALILAGSSNADAVLQIGELEWHDDWRDGQRWFVAEPGTDTLEECGRSRWLEARRDEKLTCVFRSEVLDFSGRLIDVASGEVVAAFKIRVPKVRVGDELVQTLDRSGAVLTSSYEWGSAENDRELDQRTVTQLFDRLAEILAGGHEGG